MAGEDNHGNNNHYVVRSKKTKNNHYVELCEHLQRGNWNEIKKILDGHPKILSEKINYQRRTVLHLAVFAQQESIVEELVMRMSPKDLENENVFGYTALIETTLIGNDKMAKCMLIKNERLVRIPNRRKILPVVLAVLHHHMKLARYLYQYTSLEDLVTDNCLNGATLIIQVMYTGDFGKNLSPFNIH